jgi:hypothetical protein
MGGFWVFISENCCRTRRQSAILIYDGFGLFLVAGAMKQVVIENPILNSPFEEPRRYFKFTDEGITDEIVEARRVSQYFIPIHLPYGLEKTEVIDLIYHQVKEIATVLAIVEADWGVGT